MVDYDIYRINFKKDSNAIGYTKYLANLIIVYLNNAGNLEKISYNSQRKLSCFYCLNTIHSKEGAVLFTENSLDSQTNTAIHQRCLDSLVKELADEGIILKKTYNA